MKKVWGGEIDSFEERCWNKEDSNKWKKFLLREPFATSFKQKKKFFCFFLSLKNQPIKIFFKA